MTKDAQVTSAVSQDSLEIPLIDFSTFLSPDTSTEAKVIAAKAILSGFQTAGFIYLSNHGIPKDVVNQTFSESASFFARPQSQKDALAWTTPESNRGYVAQGREKVTDATDADEIEQLRAAEGEDIKESLEIGRETEPDHPNHWPKVDGEAFRTRMLDFFERCKDLHIQVMRAIAVGLGIDERWFDEYCDAGDNTLRLLHYPAVAASEFKKHEGRVRAGAHTDYGTSIFPVFYTCGDMAGGLQVRSPNGTFVNATPIEDTIVVNAGDLLARWSNDTIKSTKHRVVEPPKPAQKEMHPARYSIAYFCNPNFDKFIDAIPGTIGETEHKKYSGVNSGEYLVQRLTATY